MKKNKNKKNTSKVETEDINISNSNYSESEYEELLKELAILEIRLDSVYIAIMATLMNCDVLIKEKGILLDKINNTNYFADQENISDEDREANRLFLFTACIFLALNIYEYQQMLLIDPEERDEKELERIKKRVISSILVLVATKLTGNILNF